MYNGILCINKPAGFTSFDVVAKLRGILKQKRIGHAGTLDPMATGVLPVFLGRATRACDISPMQDKAYKARMRFGVSTDTQDITGNVLTTAHSAVTPAQLEAQLALYTGEILQTPPMYSAVKIGGERLYKLAHKGIEVDRPKRNVTIYTANLLAFDPTAQEAELFVRCSAGTYIRTLCHDIGANLGVGATLTQLVRTEALGFTLDEALSLDEVAQVLAQGHIHEIINPTQRVFASYDQLFLDERQTTMFLSGARLDLARLHNPPAGQTVCVFGHTQQFLGLAQQDTIANELVIIKIMAAQE